jgi:hypothetical protein
MKKRSSDNQINNPFAGFGHLIGWLILAFLSLSLSALWGFDKLEGLLSWF